ncbi:hypothetical protein BDV09DRAFT_167950 [Aspergillus tetrazonus]
MCGRPGPTGIPKKIIKLFFSFERGRHYYRGRTLFPLPFFPLSGLCLCVVFGIPFLPLLLSAFPLETTGPSGDCDLIILSRDFLRYSRGDRSPSLSNVPRS